jgi:broad specificity phosphatase PhoE
VRSIYVALIRHAPTAWNAEGRILGQADPPLSPEGAARAACWRLPADLQARAAHGWLGWAASPLRRAVETARVLGAVAPVTEARLTEQDWGEWTGQARVTLIAPTSEAGWGMTPPGGESAAHVLARVPAWLDELAAGDGPDTWAAVTHMGVIRAVVASALRWNLADPAPVRLLPDCLHRVRRRGDGLLQLVGLNEPLVPQAEGRPIDSRGAWPAP